MRTWSDSAHRHTSPRPGSRTAHRRPAAAALLAVVASTSLAACTVVVNHSSGSTASPTPTSTFDPAQSSHLFPPAGGHTGKTPVVVLVPGGGWTSADPSGFADLATSLSTRGAAVVTVTYRTASDGAYFPVPEQDVACGVADAVARSRRAGVDVGQVVVVGHSAGAQIAAVVALTPEAFDGGCADPAVAPDRLVGLSGPYDVSKVTGLTSAIFGPDGPDAARAAAANPVTLAGDRPQVPALLIHGTGDATVPPSFTEQFAAALKAGGHQVVASYPEGVDHQTVLWPTVAGQQIADWLGLPG